MNKLIIFLCVSAVALFSTASADDFSKQIEARQAFMTLLGYNVSTLSGMTRGKIPYDAEAAMAAANNLKLASLMSNGSMWPAGSDMDAEFDTVAKPELWANFPEAGQIFMDLASASEALTLEAGNGLDALKSSFGAVGKTCSACHKKFRAKR